MLRDALRRPLHDLRISITDRCNFRCSYCMPREVFGRDFAFLPREELLSFEEIARLTRLFVGHGVEKIRITGGEPLLRRNVEMLVAMLAPIDGLRDLTLTTNGALLTREKALALRAAGLQRITVSLDSIDDAVFRAMNGADFPVERVLEAIEASAAAGLSPVKVDTVVRRGVNDAGIVDLARYFRGTPHILRFIEYMDVGNTNHWTISEVVAGRDIVAAISQFWPLEPIESEYYGEVAQRWRYADGAGEVGIITAVSQPFCGTCTRARLSADGKLYTCLFASDGVDLRTLMRGGASDDELHAVIARVWLARSDRYSEIRFSPEAGRHKVEMSRIGG